MTRASPDVVALLLLEVGKIVTVAEGPVYVPGGMVMGMTWRDSEDKLPVLLVSAPVSEEAVPSVKDVVPVEGVFSEEAVASPEIASDELVFANGTEVVGQLAVVVTLAELRELAMLVKFQSRQIDASHAQGVVVVVFVQYSDETAEAVFDDVPVAATVTLLVDSIVELAVEAVNPFEDSELGVSIVPEVEVSFGGDEDDEVDRVFHPEDVADSGVSVV